MGEPPKAANILIIDDNESDTMLMEEAIKDTMMANSVHIVHEGLAAVDFMNKRNQYATAPTPDLILMDWKIPDFSGKEMLKILKSDPLFRRIPVVVLSGSSSAEDIALAYDYGVNCYIVKPSNFMKFKKVISVINDFWLGITRLPHS